MASECKKGKRKKVVVVESVNEVGQQGSTLKQLKVEESRQAHTAARTASGVWKEKAKDKVKLK